jgi:hydrogenase expression/formation protein HypC
MKVVGVKKDFATVELRGLYREVNIEMIPRPQKGDYLLIHAGFAIQKVSLCEARRSLEAFAEIEKFGAQGL